MALLRILCGPLIQTIQPPPRYDQDGNDDDADDNDDAAAAGPRARTMRYAEEIDAKNERVHQILDEEEAVRERAKLGLAEIDRHQTRIRELEGKLNTARTAAQRLAREAQAPGISDATKLTRRNTAKQQLALAHSISDLIDQQSQSLYRLQSINLRQEQAVLAAQSNSALRVANARLQQNLKETNKKDIEATLNETEDGIIESDAVGALMSTTFSYTNASVPQVSDAELDSELDEMLADDVASQLAAAPGSTTTLPQLRSSANPTSPALAVNSSSSSSTTSNNATRARPRLVAAASLANGTVVEQ